ncbi:hypothetical protein [Aldersonia kunmingensis]|uniref:hypothetical protein n=1 Tax=Aldersonia kunmingensis TaxID=408066 RepID=UPI00082CA4ED|nr:hypothetical protein [Aldersonia kunmingensis]
MAQRQLTSVPRWVLVAYGRSALWSWLAASLVAGSFAAASVGSSHGSDAAVLARDVLALGAGGAIVRVIALHLRLRRVFASDDPVVRASSVGVARGHQRSAMAPRHRVGEAADRTRGVPSGRAGRRAWRTDAIDRQFRVSIAALSGAGLLPGCGDVLGAGGAHGAGRTGPARGGHRGSTYLGVGTRTFW